MGDDDRPDRSDRSDRRDRLDHTDATDPRPDSRPEFPSLTDREFAERFDLIVANWEGPATPDASGASGDVVDSDDGDGRDEHDDAAGPDAPRSRSARGDADSGTGEPTRSRTDVPPTTDRPREIHIESRSMRDLASAGPEQPGRTGTAQRPGTPQRHEPHAPTDWRVHIPPEDPDDEDYVPPPPRPLPSGDLGFWGALIGLIGGPLWLVYLAVTQDGTRLTIGAALAMTVAGFAIIVARLPRRGQREDNDDGAVV